MEWTSRFDAARARAWLMRLGCAALLLGFFGTAVGELPKNRPNERDGRGLTLATIGEPTLFHVNRVLMFLTLRGEIGRSPSSVAGGGNWKAITNQYIFSSGATLSGKLPNGTTVIALGGYFSDLAPGSGRFPELDVFWDSNNAADRAAFPEVCTVDEARIARFPSLASFRGQPFPGFADRTTCLAVNDYLGATCHICQGTRAGVTIVETVFAFGLPTVQDFVFATVRVYNDSRFINATNSPLQPPGPYPLSEAIFSFAVDADIGDASDDQIAFLPDAQTMAFWDVDFTEPAFQGPLGIGGIGLVVLPVDPNTGAEIPLAQFSVVTNGPPREDPSDKEIWRRIQEGDLAQIALEVVPRDIRGIVSTAPFTLEPDQFVEMAAAYFFAEITGAPPADLRAEGYKFLAGPQAGQLNPNANTNPAIFGGLRLAAATASASAAAGFLQPVPPPSPQVALLGGDHQITIVWDASAVTTANPFARLVRAPFNVENPVATGIILEAGDIVFVNNQFQTAAQAGIAGQEVTNELFNPNFVAFDFEGFRVYRSFTALQEDAELIAQFDLANEFAGGEFCVEATPVSTPVVLDDDGNVIGGGEFVTNVCTKRALLSGPHFVDEQGFCIGGCGLGENARFGSNTGLLFSVVDRGGSFPNPADGPGLINGLPVAYAVTSTSVNCGILLPVIPPGTETNPLAACLNLESSKVFQLGTPRSNASSFVEANVRFDALKADGTVCDTNEPAYTVDPQTGHYTGIIDCSNAIDATVSSNRGVNLPTGEFFFVIDRIEAPCDPGPAPNCYPLATGGNTVVYHWEKAGGAPATEIVPSSGSFFQNFGLGGSVAAARVGFGIDTDPSDVGNDLDIAFVINNDYSGIEDLEVNGASVHLLELGGVSAGQTRPHRVTGSSLADLINIGMMRGGGNSREYSHPGQYSTAASAFELTWEVTGGAFTGTMKRLPGGEVIPKGGQVRNAENNSTAGDFTAGYNWCIIANNSAATVRAAVSPGAAGPCAANNSVNLAIGNTMAIYVPGQSVYLEGLKQLPQNGDKWTFFIESGGGRDANTPTSGRRSSGGNRGKDPGPPPFRFTDVANSSSGRQVVMVYPGARWKLSVAGGSNEVAAADLSKIKVVPNPFIAVNEIQRGRGVQRILFTNLPPQATIRIFTISGNLVRVLEHTDGSGTEEYDVRTRFDLILASGNYYYHVTTPDGRTRIGRFAVVN